MQNVIKCMVFYNRKRIGFLAASRQVVDILGGEHVRNGTNLESVISALFKYEQSAICRETVQRILYGTMGYTKSPTLMSYCLLVPYSIVPLHNNF